MRSRSPGSPERSPTTSCAASARACGECTWIDRILKPMRIAVLGLGFMGSTHLKALRNVPGATLAAVVSSDDAKLAGDLSAIQGNLGGPGEKMDFLGAARYHTVAEALADPNIDAVDICLPTDRHA